jgi:phytoene dehydrogenase-like protein
VTLSRDLDATAESVGQFASGDAAAWRRMVEEWDRIREDLLDALFRPFPPLLPAGKLFRTLGLGGAARLARTAVLPARRFGEEWFRGDGAPILIAGCAMHSDIGVDAAGSAIYGWLLTMLGQTYGFPVPQGGAGSLATALCRRLADAGGTLQLGAPVEHILVEDGAAAGVRLRAGHTVRARRAVLADVNAPSLYEELVGLERLPRRFVADLRAFQWDAPTLKVDWALSRPVPWRDAAVCRAGTVHLGADMDGLTTFAADLARREIPKHPLVLLGQMTTSDPSRSPPGTESAWAYTHLPPRRDDLTEHEIAAHVDVLEAVIEQQAPGFADCILARYVQSPATLRDNNPNLRHGAINGGTSQIHQQLIFRPTVGMGRAATPIDRLFLAGSSAHPGGGVHGAAGSNAARAALHRDGAAGWATQRLRNAILHRLYREGELSQRG